MRIFKIFFRAIINRFIRYVNFFLKLKATTHKKLNSTFIKKFKKANLFIINIKFINFDFDKIDIDNFC